MAKNEEEKWWEVFNFEKSVMGQIILGKLKQFFSFNENYWQKGKVSFVYFFLITKDPKIDYISYVILPAFLYVKFDCP